MQRLAGGGLLRLEIDPALAADPTACILRISLPMGISFNGHAGAIDWIQSRFRPGRPATLYFDEVRSCTYCDDLNRVFERFHRGTAGAGIPGHGLGLNLARELARRYGSLLIAAVAAIGGVAVFAATGGSSSSAHNKIPVLPTSTTEASTTEAATSTGSVAR